MHPTDQTSTIDGQCSSDAGRRGHERTRFGIALEAEHDLRCPIPPGRHVLCHVPSVLLRILREPSGQTEVADFEFAIGVDEQVSRFQVSVEDICRVDIFEATQDLVYERLEVGICQRLARSNDGSQITLHQLCVMSVGRLPESQ